MVTSSRKSSVLKGESTSIGLNSDLTFDNFVVGKANQLAHAAAIQVAENLGVSYNPLFIYGGTGRGKSHLLHAIGNQIAKQNPLARICYINATNFVHEVVKAYQTKKFDEFRQLYSALDLLLIDDIQFIAHKPGTQQELLNTLNSLATTNKQLVVSGNTLPKEDSGIDSCLLSRLAGGLSVAINRPSRKLRLELLRKFSADISTDIDEGTLRFMAEHDWNNVRALSGAINRVDAFTRFHNRHVHVKVAKKALKGMM